MPLICFALWYTLTKLRYKGRAREEWMVGKIALEGHFLCPAFEGYWQATVSDVDPKILAQVVARLSDFGELRLKSMDGAGIERSVLSIAGPGGQAEHDAATAVRIGRAGHDF